jgi:hypothetical protein
MMMGFKGALSPDFSIFNDYPKAVQIFNCYRSHWLAAYWQIHQVPVIPTVTWADEDSFEFCFEGYVKGSVVAVGTVGTAFSQPDEKYGFLLGYDEMLDRIKLTTVIGYGNKNDLLGEDVIWFESYAEKYLRDLGL